MLLVQRQREEKGHDGMVMNYAQTIADIRAEIERLEREYGVAQAYVATFRLLNAMELLAEANRRSIRLKRRDRVEDVRAKDVLR